MRHTRSAWLAAVAGGVMAVPLLLLALPATPAAAATACPAAINGSDATAHQTPATAYKVQEHSQVVVTGSDPGLSPGSPLQYLIQMQFYYPWGQKFSWTVASGETTSQTFQRTVDVDKYATKSTGLYLVHVVAFGAIAGQVPCQADAFVDVVSSSASDAEIAAGILGVAGIAGTLGAGLLASREGSALSDADVMAAAAEDEALDTLEFFGGPFGMCALMVPVAVTLTAKALLSDLARHALSHITRSVT